MMDATLGQSTQPLLLSNNYIFHGLFLAVKLFLILAFSFALFAAACIFRRKWTGKEQPNSQGHRLYIFIHLSRIFSHLFLSQGF